MQVIYERYQRPPEKQHQPWLDRVQRQLRAAYDALEAAAEKSSPWLLGEGFSQADITVAVAWRFTRHYVSDLFEVGAYPALSAHSARAEQLAEFVSTPLL